MAAGHISVLMLKYIIPIPILNFKVAATAQSNGLCAEPKICVVPEAALEPECQSGALASDTAARTRPGLFVCADCERQESKGDVMTAGLRGERKRAGRAWRPARCGRSPRG